MKLIIQIPCFNEEDTLPGTLAELPRTMPGIDVIEWLIIDDGSTDATVQVARQHGVHHVVQHRANSGLAKAFATGLEASLAQGADIIVNTDGDNQYPGRYVQALVQPILDGQAEMVIGDRQTHTIAHFSRTKKLLQRVGSDVVRYASGVDVPDAPSGFRAMTRETALRLNIFTHYTYTLETLIQAGNKNITVMSVPIETNAKVRESRLISSIPSYVWRSSMTIYRMFMLYKPLRTFTYIAVPFLLAGGALWLRFLILMMIGQSDRGSHVQSIVVGAVFIILSFVIMMFGFIGDLIAINRRLHEDMLYQLKRERLSGEWSTLSHENPGESSQ